MAKKAKPKPRAKKPDADFQIAIVGKLGEIRNALNRIADYLILVPPKVEVPDADGQADTEI